MNNLRRNMIIMTLLLCLSVVLYGCNDDEKDIYELPNENQEVEETLNEEENIIDAPEMKEVLDEDGNTIEKAEKKGDRIVYELPVERPVLVEE